MSQPRYTLSIDGAAQIEPQEIGAQLLKRDRFSMKTDTLTMTFPRGFNSGVPLAYDQRVNVYADGVPFFAGRVGRPGHDQDAAAGRYSVTLLGPWDELERWTSLRDFNGTYGGTYGLPAWINTSTLLRSQYSLFGHNSFGSGIMPTGYQALYAIAPVEFAQRAAPLFTTAAIPAGETPPNLQTVTGLKVAEIVRQTARWTPQIAYWMDYSTAVPVLRALPMEPIVLSGAVSNYWVTIDPDRVVVGTLPTTPPRWEFDYYVYNEEEVAEEVVLGGRGAAFSGAVRWDMVPEALTIRSAAGGIGTYPSVDRNQADIVWLERSGGSVPSALVEYLYKSLATPRLEGTLTLNEGRPSLTARPGRLWDLIGDDAATSRGVAAAWTQTVSDNLLTGVTTCQLGFPQHLGVAQQLSLSWWSKLMGG